MRSLLLKGLKARPPEQPFELLVDQASISYGNFALQGSELLLMPSESA